MVTVVVGGTVVVVVVLEVVVGAVVVEEVPGGSADAPVQDAVTTTSTIAQAQRIGASSHALSVRPSVRGPGGGRASMSPGTGSCDVVWV
jgi:hypothetical protein